MKQLVIMVILSLSMINCKGQQTDTVKQNNIKKDTMEYFNENKYKDWEFDQKHSFKTEKYYKKDNQIVRIILFYKDEIAEEMSQINSPFKEYKYYHKNTLLKNSIKQFYDFSVGITKEYDESGKLIKETNWDKNYPFKVEDLCKLIKEEYGVNLMVNSNKDELQYRVERRYESTTKQHLYLVAFTYGNPDIEPGDKTFPPIKVVYIDGNNGKILYEEAHSLKLPNGDKIPNSKSKFPQKGEKEKNTSGIYKTHEGKSYTKAQWEAYEEKQWEEYCKRTGRTYIPKKQEPGIKSQETRAKSQEPRAENQAKKSTFLAEDWEHGDADTPKKEKGFWDKLFG